MHVQIKIYQEFYHGIIYIANEGYFNIIFCIVVVFSVFTGTFLFILT